MCPKTVLSSKAGGYFQHHSEECMQEASCNFDTIVVTRQRSTQPPTASSPSPTVFSSRPQVALTSAEASLRRRVMPPRQKLSVPPRNLPLLDSALWRDSKSGTDAFRRDLSNHASLSAEAQAELSRYSLLRFGVIATCPEQRLLSRSETVLVCCELN